AAPGDADRGAGGGGGPGLLSRSVRSAHRGVRLRGGGSRGAGGGNGPVLRGEERRGRLPQDARRERTAPADAGGRRGPAVAPEQDSAGDDRARGRRGSPGVGGGGPSV